MSLIWIPASASVPPGPRDSSASGTSSPAGAKMIAESRGTGDGSNGPPTDAAPSSRRQLCAQQRSVSDDPGAQQRRSLFIGERGWYPVGEDLWYHRELGIPPVCVPSRVTRLRAEVLPT